MAVRVMSAYDIAVVGAGFAGLSAAVRLAKGGARVLVLEARSRLGGRATAFPDRDTGALVDNGQHVLLGCYTHTLAFLDEIGASTHVSAQRALRVTMIDPAGKRSRLECPDLPAPFHLVAGVFDWEALGWADRLSVLSMARPLRAAQRALRPGAAGIAASPGETVENWLIRNGQTARLREMLWDPLALAALNQPAAVAAAPPFARVLAEMFGSDPSAARIVLPSRPLHLMYAEPARRYIEQRGGRVLTGMPARIDVANGAVEGITAGDDRWPIRYAVSAVPWHAIGAAIGGERAPVEDVIDRATRMSASPIVSVHLWFDRAVLDEPFVGLPGRTFQWAFDTTSVTRGAPEGHTPASAAGSVSMVSSGAAPVVGWTNETLIETARREIEGALEAARHATVVSATAVREPRATFSLAPGQPPRPGARTEVDGLLLAGDWTDTGLPATIESAVRSGHAAADVLLS
jgi:squalene-associated FAD-dependent desaturase